MSETRDMTVVGESKSRAVTVGRYNKAAEQYASRSLAKETIRKYVQGFREFRYYCETLGTERPVQAGLADSVELVLGYISTLAERGSSVSTVEQRLAAIAWAYRTANQPDPTVSGEVKAVMAGIRRTHGAPPAKREPAQLEELSAMLDTLDETVKGVRDKALLLVGYAGAFRRSELVALDVRDLRFNKNELRLLVRKSKTDKWRTGMTKTIPNLPEDKADLCPVRALREWLDVAGIKSGAVFRRMHRGGHVSADRLTDQTVALVVKNAAKAAGLDWRRFSGHSLRSGFVTQSMDVGASDSDIMDQTGHKSVAVMRGYRKSTGVGSKRAVRAAFGRKPRKTRK